MADDGYGGLSLGPGDGSPIPGPNMTEASVRYLLTQISKDRVMRIDILRTASAVLLGFQALLGSRRRRCGNKAFLLPLWAAYTVSYTVVAYTIGLIQSADAPDEARVNDLWVVQLLLLLGSADALSAFSRHDVEQSKGMQAQHVLQTLLVLWLLVSRGILSPATFFSTLLDPPFDVLTAVAIVVYELVFFFFWVYSIVKMAQRMMALRMASSSHGLVRSAKVVADYMHAQAIVEKENQSEDAGAADHHPRPTMSDYKYLVHGEEEHSDPPSGPAYRTKVHLGVKKAITIDMIFQHHCKLLSAGDKPAACSALKDTCLSFALFKLLKRRFCACELEIAEANLPKTRSFVLDVLPGDSGDYERVFRVVDLELSFLYDFFYTKYPALFAASRAFDIVRIVFLVGFFLSLILVIVADIWLLNPIILTKGTASTQIFTSFNNILFVAIIVAVEVLQPLVAGHSNWAVVHFVCDHVRKKGKGWHCGIRRSLIKWVAVRRATRSRYWDNKLGQYSLLKSYNYHPTFHKKLSLLTIGLMEPIKEGRKNEPAVELSTAVKKAVFDSLKENGGNLTNGRTSVRRFQGEIGGGPPTTTTTSSNGHSSPSSVDRDLLWACDLETHTHTILVWHIATTICHQSTASADRARLACAPPLRPSVRPKWLPGGATAQGWCSGPTRQPLGGPRGSTPRAQASLAPADPTFTNRLVATSLSGYCAYLLAFVPEMLPDHSYKATQILDAVIMEARDRDKKSKEKAEDKLELGVDDVKGRGILDLGDELGSQLVKAAKENEESLWKLLAEFWAELVLFLAPSDNADVHSEYLARGGEFMTHLWALLTHAGILSRPTGDTPVARVN